MSTPGERKPRMANNYSQFSEAIEEITPEEAAWINRVLHLDIEDKTDLAQLKKELVLKGDHDLDMWPYFEWALEGKDGSSLWLYSEEGLIEDHLIWFMQAFIRKFRPDFIFSVTGSATCSKPRIGEFGGWWLVISKHDVQGGNTWDATHNAAKEIQARMPDPEKEHLWKRIEARFSSEGLDDHVHGLVSKEASAINNSGLRDQFDYLFKEAGKAWLEGLLDERCPHGKLCTGAGACPACEGG
jgi:hypothetical protein